MNAPAPASNGVAKFKASFPFDFSLFDENSHYVLYITDDPTEEHRLTLELKNTSGQDISFPEPADKIASAGNCHFELKFRKGTLSRKSLALITNSTNGLPVLTDDFWDIALDQTESGTESLFFLCKDPEKLFQGSNKLLESGKHFTVTLQHISADAGPGARGTRVEFIPRKMTYADGNTPVTGRREQHLFITNHSGQKHIPLHTSFVGSNRILNDGVDHPLPFKLIVQIQNIGKPSQEHLETSTITLKADQEDGKASKFIISADVQEGVGKDKPWALCKASEFHLSSTVKVFKLVGGVEREEPEASFKEFVWAAGEGQSRQITLVPTKDIHLDMGDFLEIEFSDFQSSLPSGVAHMYVHYHNIPGYWDGRFVLTIEKAPLLFTADKNVSIGTTGPTEDQIDRHQLDVRLRAGQAGNSAIRATYAGGGNLEGTEFGALAHRERKWNAVYAKAGNSNALALYTDGDVNMMNGNVGIGTASNFSGTLTVASETPLGFNTNNKNRARFRVSGGDDTSKLHIDIRKPGFHGTTTVWQEALMLHGNGNSTFYGKLGIGTASNFSGTLTVGSDTPLGFNNADNEMRARFRISGDKRSAKLHIDILKSTGSGWQEALMLHGNGDSTFSGNVGIGTTTPGAKLDISGAANISAGVTVGGATTLKDNVDVGSFQEQDRFMTMKVAGGNKYRSGLKLWAWEENYGCSIQYDERSAANGLHIKKHAQDVDGDTLMFFDWWEGNVGIGTTSNFSGSLTVASDTPLGFNNADNEMRARFRVSGGNTTAKLHIEVLASSGSGWQEALVLYGNGDVAIPGDLWVYSDGWKKLLFPAFPSLPGLPQLPNIWIKGTPSDGRLKRNVRPLMNASEKVQALQGVTYQWNEDGIRYLTQDIEQTLAAAPDASEEENEALWMSAREKRAATLSGQNVGLIAQEVEAVVPEVVHTDEKGYKSINYGHLTALLVEAIKEQNGLIECLLDRVTALEATR